MIGDWSIYYGLLCSILLIDTWYNSAHLIEVPDRALLLPVGVCAILPHVIDSRASGIHVEAVRSSGVGQRRCVAVATAFIHSYTTATATTTEQTVVRIVRKCLLSIILKFE